MNAPKAQSNLRKELRSSGASDAEMADLLALAGQLRQLKAGVASHTHNPISPKLVAGSWKHWLRPAYAAAMILLIVTVVVAHAQASLPGSSFYGVKRLSENTVMAVDPAFRAHVMMRRAEEVKQLVAAHASSATVLAALNSYKSEAAAYKTLSYAALEQCKTSLRQAASHANPSEKRLIASTIASMPELD